MKVKTIWCYVHGQCYCDAVAYALAMNMPLPDAMRALEEEHSDMDVYFRATRRLPRPNSTSAKPKKEKISVKKRMIPQMKKKAAQRTVATRKRI